MVEKLFRTIWKKVNFMLAKIEMPIRLKGSPINNPLIP
jgi:hypothetical protein